MALTQPSFPSTTLSGIQKRNATVLLLYVRRIGTCIGVLPLEAGLPDWEIDLRKPPIEPEEKKQKRVIILSVLYVPPRVSHTILPWAINIKIIDHNMSRNVRSSICEAQQ